MPSVFRSSAFVASLVLGGLATIVACGGDEETAPRPGTEGEATPSTTGTETAPGTTPPVTTPPGSSSGTPGTPTAGCGAPAKQSGFASGLTVQVEGKARTYALFVPPSYDPNKAYPLVFGFHGDGGNGAGIRSTMKLEEQANGEAIFVYPDGLSKTWELDQAAATNKDIKLVTALVDELSSTYCTDATRRFAAGFSRGAYFANQLACRSPRPFRAVATHGGGGPYGLDGEYGDDGNWKCTAPMPAALVVHGTGDGLGDTGKESRDFYRSRNQCKTTSSSWSPSPCVAYDGCSAGKNVNFCLISGMGHSFWQNGAAATWSFFSSQ